MRRKKPKRNPSLDRLDDLVRAATDASEKIKTVSGTMRVLSREEAERLAGSEGVEPSLPALEASAPPPDEPEG